MARRYGIYFLPLLFLIGALFERGRAAWILLALWAVGSGAVMIGLLHPRSRMFGRSLSRTFHPSRIALTFDDGPHPDDTPAILKILEEHAAKGTFFFVGNRAREHPELVRRVVRAGHEVGAHSATHPWWFSLATPGRIRREVRESVQVLEEITGARPRWFRPPMGHRNPALVEALGKERLEMVTWSSRAYDTLPRGSERVLRSAVAGAAPGGILLLHEGVGRKDGEPSRTVAALPAILRDLKEKGLEPVRLSDLLDNSPNPT
jgi:peptidoglycan/xylan/chitin deacetylase (PgdA/CDA1 family)